MAENHEIFFTPLVKKKKKKTKILIVRESLKFLLKQELLMEDNPVYYSSGTSRCKVKNSIEVFMAEALLLCQEFYPTLRTAVWG